MLSLLFVCTGNTCRSKMAQSLAKEKLKKRGLEKSVKVSSAGLNIEPESSTAKEALLALKNLGITARKTKAKALQSVHPEKFSFIVCMTTSHKNALLSRYNNARVFSFDDLCGGGDIGDPIGLGLIEYKKVALDLNQKIDLVLDKLITVL